MTKTFKILLLTFISCLLLAQNEKDFNGKWTLIKDNSTDIDLYENLSLNFSIKGSDITLNRIWGSGRSHEEKLNLKTDGKTIKIPVTHRVFPTNAFMGFKMPEGEKIDMTAGWENNGTILKITESFNLIGSQGAIPVSEVHTFEISKDKATITYIIDRSTRKTGPGIKYILKKAGTNNAYYMKMTDNWEIDGKLPEQALLISLQGIVNEESPKLYFIYGEQWDFRFTPTVYDYLKGKRNFTFTQLNSAEQAINTFKQNIKGYILWDKNVRTSLIVAFTLAGLEKGIVITEDLIPTAEKAGLKLIDDFRGRFVGKSDYEIYSWAYEKYWERCSKDYIVWLGGEHGKIMRPGVADFGITKKVFFNDLSTRESDTLEYGLSKKLFSEMNTYALVMGWHSYKKDKEREHVKLASNYGLRVEGLHTLPNMSFMARIPVSEGFKFKNRHNLKQGEKYIPKEKVYISCVQTDCLGLGAWTKPGRGEMPYAWEVTMNWQWLAPAMLEFFYSQATPNDYFIGSLSGPGYMYPKAIPPKFMPKILDMAKDLMEKLDLNVFEIMDYSEGATVEGNTELTKEVTEQYYKAMPNSIGFINGYAPSYTFTVKDKRPFISFDYYLSPTRPEADAVADLNELASVNKKRPYFLLMHVRQWSDISRVKNILHKLGPEFEVVPLDIFLKMAGENPTYKEKFLEKREKEKTYMFN